MARPRSRLTPDEQQRILDGVAHGMGRYQVSRRLGISRERVDRERSDNPAFRALFNEAIRFRVDNLIEIMYNRAMDGDVEALKFMISRDDKTNMFLRELKVAKELREKLADMDAKLSSRVNGGRS